MIASILIPKARVAVLVGAHGSTKKSIEEKTNTKIFIGEEITIEGEALGILTVENIVKAIGGGFSPGRAMELLDEDKILYIIQLPKADEKRIKSRIIGKMGRARRNLERMTNTHISVYGKTVAIIGYYDDMEASKEAIEKLIFGSTHSNVYSFLERRKHG